MSGAMSGDKKVVYESNGLTLISAMLPTKNGMALMWKPWKPRFIEIFDDATMVYRKGKGTPEKILFNLSKVLVTSMAHSVSDKDNNETVERGITVKCTTKDGIEAQFRCIFTGGELERFTDALKLVATEYAVTSTKRSSHIPSSVNVAAVLTPQSPAKKSRFLPSFTNTRSVMRSTVAYEMDKYDLLNTHERIVARRGELKWLPVAFSNDLVHGSWWFVLGSLLFMVSSIVIIANSNHTMGLDMGTDDSNLSPASYRYTWGLMLLSGIFSTLGSMAFVRAVHEDPPMKPLFLSWYHLQNDELLGSWLFLLAIIPAIPYCIIYLANDNFNSLIFAAGLLLSIVCAFAAFLFVRACYPSDKKRVKILKPLTRVLCWCCCKKAWMKRHLANDWLAGTWFFLWASIPATIGCFGYFISALAGGNSLKIFLMGTTFMENVCFLIGSCYFVSGSYPESSLVNDEEWDDQSVGSADPDEHLPPADEDGEARDVESGTGEGVLMAARQQQTNDLAYDAGNDSDEESSGNYSLRVGGEVIRDRQMASPTSVAVGHRQANGGDNSPSTKNPLTAGL